MSRFFAALGLCVALLAVGCASVRPATFVGYEMVDSGQRRQTLTLSGAVDAGPLMVPGDRATVRLDSGAEVLVDCPLRGLTRGDSVSVRSNPDGSLAVVP